jgi:hypothetical protein
VKIEPGFAAKSNQFLKHAQRYRGSINYPNGHKMYQMAVVYFKWM